MITIGDTGFSDLIMQTLTNRRSEVKFDYLELKDLHSFNKQNCD